MFYKQENIPIRTGGSSAAAAAIIARKLAQEDTRTSFYIGVILFVWTNFYVYERTTSKKIQKSNKAKMGNKFFFVASMVRRRWATISTDGDGYSLGAAAEGDAVSDGELADLDAVVGGEGLVELEDEVAVVADVLAHGRVGGEHDGSVPEGVVVAEESADLDELHEALVVVEVVVLVGVDEDEVEGPVVGDRKSVV